MHSVARLMENFLETDLVALLQGSILLQRQLTGLSFGKLTLGRCPFQRACTDRDVGTGIVDRQAQVLRDPLAHLSACAGVRRLARH